MSCSHGPGCTAGGPVVGVVPVLQSGQAEAFHRARYHCATPLATRSAYMILKPTFHMTIKVEERP